MGSEQANADTLVFLYASANNMHQKHNLLKHNRPAAKLLVYVNSIKPDLEVIYKCKESITTHY